MLNWSEKIDSFQFGRKHFFSLFSIAGDASSRRVASRRLKRRRSIWRSTSTSMNFRSIDRRSVLGDLFLAGREISAELENFLRVLETRFEWIRGCGFISHYFPSKGTQGGCVAQRKHSCVPPNSPRFESQHLQDFFSLLLSLWTVLRSNPF